MVGVVVCRGFIVLFDSPLTVFMGFDELLFSFWVREVLIEI